jgi:hypothetical protein
LVEEVAPLKSCADAISAGDSFPPIADISYHAPMRCFRVLIHGAFSPRLKFASAPSASGFYTTRWVVTANAGAAIAKAFQATLSELERWADVRDGLIGVEMKAEEVASGSWWRWLKGGGRGFAFYTDE